MDLVNGIRRWRVKWQPEAFQGWGKNNRYFEGWYIKMISADERTAIAVIPGIAYDEQGSGEAFIQVLDGRRNRSDYHPFPAKTFEPAMGRFALRCGGNSFSLDHLHLDLPGLKAELQFQGRVPWPVKPWSPGIMGWYAFVPFMECYHGIVNMDGTVKGTLEMNGEVVRMDGGKVYMEKDWGRSFPSSWIWMQSNHFDVDGTSFKASVARIPWIGNAFVGFIAGLWHDGHLYRFTTYTGARLERVEVQDRQVGIRIRDSRHVLEIEARREAGADLASPVLGSMKGRVNESMQAALQVSLRSKGGQRIFESGGRNAGLEVAGPYEELLMP